MYTDSVKLAIVAMCVSLLVLVEGSTSHTSTEENTANLSAGDVDLGVCGNSVEAADVCLVCHVLKIRDVQSCCTTRQSFSLCNTKFSELSESVRGGGVASEDYSDILPLANALEAEKRRGKGRIFGSFNRAWYKGKRGGSPRAGHRVFTNFNRMWFKSRG